MCYSTYQFVLISYDYHHKIIAEEEASMYFSLVKIIITQLDSVENEKKTN